MIPSISRIPRPVATYLGADNLKYWLKSNNKVARPIKIKRDQQWKTWTFSIVKLSEVKTVHRKIPT